MRKAAGLATIIALALFVAFFAFLALDLAWRIWVTRATFESGIDVALIVGLEAARALATLTTAAVAVWLAGRHEAGHRALAVSLLFLGLWYAKATTFVFPGYAQERLARALVDAGVAREVLVWIFGKPAWALAPAVTAFLLFSLRYPSAPEPGRVRDVHATGRRGMLRHVALAGTDVRSLLHRAAAATLATGGLRPLPVVVAGAAATLGLAFGGPAFRVGVWAVLAGSAALALAFLRTAWVLHGGETRRRLGRLAVAAAAAFAGVVAGAALNFLPGAASAQVALVLSSAAPVAAAFLLVGFASTPAPVADAG